jgi:hypothetical protein
MAQTQTDPQLMTDGKSAVVSENTNPSRIRKIEMTLLCALLIDAQRQHSQQHSRRASIDDKIPQVSHCNNASLQFNEKRRQIRLQPVILLISNRDTKQSNIIDRRCDKFI